MNGRIYDQLLEEVSNRKLQPIINFNSLLLKHKSYIEDALQTFPDDKETTQLKEKLVEFEEIPLNATLDDLSTIETCMERLKSFKAIIIRRLEETMPELKCKFNCALDQARTEIKTLDALCSREDAKVNFSVAELAKKVKEDLLNAISKASPTDQESIQRQLELINELFYAYTNYEKIKLQKSKLSDNSLLQTYFDAIKEAQNYISINELKLMGTNGSHHTLSLIDRIRFGDKLEHELKRTAATAAFLQSVPGPEDQYLKIEFKGDVSLGVGKLLEVKNFLTKPIEDCLVKSSIETKAEPKDINLKADYCQKRDEIALAKLKEVNQYFKKASRLAVVASVKILKKESKAEPQGNKPNSNHAGILKKLRAKAPVSKVGLAVANAVPPPVVINKTRVQFDAANLHRLAMNRQGNAKKIVAGDVEEILNRLGL